MKLLPDNSVTSIKGIGPLMAQKLHHLQIYTVADLLKHIPRTYIDYTIKVGISHLEDGQTATFQATITQLKTFYSKTGKLITTATAADKNGRIDLVWFNNPYIKRLIVTDQLYNIAGKVTRFSNRLSVVSPTIEEHESPGLNTSGLAPIYPLTQGITSKWLRKIIHTALESTHFTDPVPIALLSKLQLPSLYDSLHSIHFPPSRLAKQQADKRLTYNEHLKINLQNSLEKTRLGPSVKVHISPNINKTLLQKLPFTLTSDQKRIIKDLENDLQQYSFTHRLIQGETGSGKTVLLLFAAHQCLQDSASVAILAPTEILATQHYQTFTKFSPHPNRVHLVTASNKMPTVNEPGIFIGTHALLNSLGSGPFPLALVAIDEQHKFGVSQRDALTKQSPVPHLLNLTATPIPRTMALGLLGDIEISNLITTPQNRLPTKTFVISPTKFKKSPNWLIQKLQNRSHVFVVCPHIHDHQNAVFSVEKQADVYQLLYGSQYPVFILHGEMTPADQQVALEKFKASQGGILVSTPLIEVGVDIPTADVIIIHSAERFGLAQLHQLRGRVGRGNKQGYCFLVPSTDDETETTRLQLLTKYKNGLTLAKKDLFLRGAGDIYGVKQHGAIQTRLKSFWSKKIFTQAKSDAQTLVNQSPKLATGIVSQL